MATLFCIGNDFPLIFVIANFFGSMAGVYADLLSILASIAHLRFLVKRMETSQGNNVLVTHVVIGLF